MLAASVVVGAASAVLERARPGTCLPEVHGWMKRASWFAVVEAATVVTLFLGWLAWVDVEPLFDLSETIVAVQVALNWLLSTFVFYWWHRVRHSSDALWRWTHQLHHSPRRIETITAFYKHPFEVAADTLLNLVLSFVVLGVSTEAFLLHVSCVACSQFFVHMNVATPRWIGFFLSRPEMHRIHHELGAHKNNYADLPLWDMLFGTYENPYARPVECGFAAGREARVLDMLLLRDTHATTIHATKEDSHV
ncbi:MAG TPA: sterol desaturase family protein [Casimicrobium sp.]|nr:sterol desaturase family protein [Casimicrobium sp.]